jgi:phosphopentomutase
MSDYERIILLVLDGVGIGALPDAASFGDEGADTLGNLAREVGGLHLPVMESLGLGAVATVKGVGSSPRSGAFGRMAELSAGKDSALGHWELAGVVSPRPFPTFPAGFPAVVVEEFGKITGRGVLGNRPASGTEIMEELGEEHLRTGKPILYTSADSVFQVAAHGEVVPLPTLLEWCRRARSMLDEKGCGVLRVIARPFRGRPGAFERAGRRDYSLPPPEETVLEWLQQQGHPVLGIGKVGDLFCGRGLDAVRSTSGTAEGMEILRRSLADRAEGLIIGNLLDFDTLYGHRNDAAGFAGALEQFDAFLGDRLLPSLKDTDLLLLTADHGCDPTHTGTDHTREYVPLLAASPSLKRGIGLGTRTSFGDVAATVCEALSGHPWRRGRSFLSELVGG